MENRWLLVGGFVSLHSSCSFHVPPSGCCCCCCCCYQRKCNVSGCVFISFYYYFFSSSSSLAFIRQKNPAGIALRLRAALQRTGNVKRMTSALDCFQLPGPNRHPALPNPPKSSPVPPPPAPQPPNLIEVGTKKKNNTKQKWPTSGPSLASKTSSSSPLQNKDNRRKLLLKKS